jgi:hypothetical protein
LEFHFIQLKLRFAFNRGAQHFQTNLRRRRLQIELVWGSRGGNEEESVEPKRFNCLASEDQMPVMDRIERSAKDADSFQDFISSDGRAN